MDVSGFLNLKDAGKKYGAPPQHNYKNERG